MARTPSLAVSSAAVLAPAALRSTMPMSAPSAASAAAIARPIPLAPPVTSATLPLSLPMAVILLCCGRNACWRKSAALDFTRCGYDGITRGGYRDFDTRAPAIMSRAMPTKRSIVGVVSAERQVIPVSKSGAVPPRFL